MRWLGDKSLACSQASPLWTGAPGSHQRTWEEKDGAQPHQKLLYPYQGSVTPRVKAFEKTIFNPRTLVRTRGTRPGGKAWWQTGKAEDELAANPNQS